MDDRLKRAALLLEAQRATEAREMLAKALAAEPDNPQALALLAHACSRLGEPEEQARAAGRLIAVAPESAEGHRYYSLAVRSLGRHDEALRHGRRAVELSPHRCCAHLALAWALATKPGRRGRRETLSAASQAASRAGELSGGCWDAHYAQAVVALRRGRAYEAEQSLRAALRLEPECAPALKLLGDMRLHTDRPIAAARLLVATLVADPTEHAARDDLAEVTKRLASLPTFTFLILAGLVTAVLHGYGKLEPAGWPVRIGTTVLLAPLAPAWIAWSVRRMGPRAHQQLLSTFRRGRGVAPVAGLAIATWIATLLMLALPVPAFAIAIGVAAAGALATLLAQGFTHKRGRTARTKSR